MGVIRDMNTVMINDLDVADAGARLVDGYTVSGSEVDMSTFQGRGRTHFSMAQADVKLKSIQFTLRFTGKSRHDVLLQKSRLDQQAASGQCELYMPDGFYYLCVADTIGDLALSGKDGVYVHGAADYTFNGICHGALKEVALTGDIKTLTCESTAGRTDCRLSCTLSKDYETFTLGTVTYTGVKKGQVLTADGIEGRVLIDGAPAPGNMTFIHFPYLTAGENVITCVEPVTVSYYPTYV